MFLKRIVLHGFKSFADRTQFEFGSGLTCIVGPNGCGKSNVLDAVRWVLGERSAHNLRGDKMSDVIFAGSRTRKPAAYAEVELTFDNRSRTLRSDLDEVVVGRLLYRSGESEYRLNGNPCRLKDIKDLLLDTGVGVDAYSVIEQGRVDLLLQADSLQRREIFEEAAGINRYKVRRVEAQRKLERTQANLLRLQDVLDELEKRLRSVKLAAGKARSYLEYDGRLRQLRSSFALAEYHELEQDRQRQQQAADDLTAQVQQQRALLARCDAEASELAHVRQALDEQVQGLETQLAELHSTLSAVGERIVQGEKRTPELLALRQRRLHQAAELAERVRADEARLAAEKAALGQLAAAATEWQHRLDELQRACQAARQRAADARAALEHEKVATFEAARRGALLQNQQENCAAQQARLTAQTERLAARHAQVEREHANHLRRLEELTQQAAALDQQAAEFSESSRRTAAELEARTAEIQQLDGEIGAAKEYRSGLLSRVALLEDMERRQEGVDQGTRSVLAWREQEGGADLVVGLVADVLRIDDPRVTLLQQVLSESESHVVVRSTERFLAELARRGDVGGPLRVVLLDRLPAALSPVSYAHAPGFVACAADWVRCAPEFRPLAQHLLGRTFIVQTLEQALELAREALGGCVFVTLAGQTVAADGRLAVGVGPAAAGLFSRKAEVRRLRIELDDVERRLQQLTRRRRELEETASDLELQRQALLQSIAAVQRRHAELRSEQVRVEEARQRLEREARLVADELQTTRRSLEDVAAELRALQAESAAAGAAHQEHETRIAALARTLAGAEAEAAHLAQQCTEAQVECGRIVEKHSAGQQSLVELEQRYRALAEEHTRSAAEAADVDRQIEATERELNQARQSQMQLADECARCRDQVLRLREQRQQLRQRLEDIQAAGRERQRHAEELDAQLHARQVALREAEVRKENLVVRVREELGMDLAALYRTYEHTTQDWEAVKAEIEELRGKIARLGNVNLDAIGELEELAPRYEHLVAQRADLHSAMERLEALMAELDRESRTRFAAAFEQIRGNFQQMFRKLFGGGKADILLEDPENPLECGIEIIARPPGKEPQSISLLSGGEKTLTAVALLMGVFMSRPSPFAILDEVDAALDESNVERFNKVLQEFLTRSQFVVITHSKRTMSCADVLYGVTMEEPGVSQRVSVRFEERVQAPSVA